MINPVEKIDENWPCGNKSSTIQLAKYRLTAPVLDTKTASWVFPFDRAVDASNRTGAAFETACKFNGHLSLLRQGVKVSWAGVDTKSLLAGVADILIE
jgi:hypothetical protein